MKIVFKKPCCFWARIISCILIQAFLLTNIAWAEGAGIVSEKHTASRAYLSPQLSINIQDIQDGFIYFSKANGLPPEAKIPALTKSILLAKDGLNFYRNIQAGISKSARFFYDNLLRAFAAVLVMASMGYAAETKWVLKIDFNILNEVVTFIVAYIAACGIAAGIGKVISKYADFSPKEFKYIHGFLTWLACSLILNHYFYAGCLALFSVHGLLAPIFIAYLIIFIRGTSNEHNESIYDEIALKELKDRFLQDQVAKIGILRWCDFVFVIILTMLTIGLFTFPLILLPIHMAVVRVLFNGLIERRFDEIVTHIVKNYGSAEELLREHINHRPDIKFKFSENRTKHYHLTTGAAGPMVALSVLKWDLTFYNKLPHLAYRFYPWYWFPFAQNIRQLPIGAKDMGIDMKKTLLEEEELTDWGVPGAPVKDEKSITRMLERLTSDSLLPYVENLYKKIEGIELTHGTSNLDALLLKISKIRSALKSQMFIEQAI